jgi:hypothetical protein
VILYWISRLAYFVQGFCRKVKYITLVNLLADGGLEEAVGSGQSAVGSEKGSGGRGQGSGVRDHPSSLIPDSSSLASSPNRNLLAKAESARSFGPLQTNADRVLFPEYLTYKDKSAQIAGHIIEWLTDPARRAARVEALAALKAEVAHGGASSRAAEYIFDTLAKRRQPVRPPHFVTTNRRERGEGREESHKRPGIAFRK